MKVIIFVKGGIVTGAVSDNPDLDVAVLDRDDQEVEDSEEELARLQALDDEADTMHAVY